MKIKELAAELSLSGEEVLEKAKSMGIDVSGTGDDMSDIDATSVKNTILRSGTHTETKVVRVKPKKSDADKKDEPKVTVKAANIKLPEVKKAGRTSVKQHTTRTAAAKPPAGKPVVSKEVEGRPKPPEGKPVVSKAMLEERIAREKESVANSEKPAAAEKSAPAVAPKPEVKTPAPEPKAQETPKKEEEKKGPAVKEPPRRRSGLKVIKKAEDVRREEAEAAERRAAKRKAAEEKAAAEKASSDRSRKNSNRKNSDPQKRQTRR